MFQKKKWSTQECRFLRMMSITADHKPFVVYFMFVHFKGSVAHCYFNSMSHQLVRYFGELWMELGPYVIFSSSLVRYLNDLWQILS